MPKSTRELVLEVLYDLKATAIGQDPAAEDYAFVKGKVFPLLAELKANRVLDIFVDPTNEDSQDIPDHLFNGLAFALADKASSLVGAAPSPDPNNSGVWQRLRTAASVGPSYLTQIAEYF